MVEGDAAKGDGTGRMLEPVNAVRLRTHKVIHYTLIVYLPIVSLDKIDGCIANQITNTTKENFEILTH